MVNLESSEKAYGVSLGNIRDRGGQQRKSSERSFFVVLRDSRVWETLRGKSKTELSTTSAEVVASRARGIF